MLTEAHGPVLDHGLDEVHRRRADEGRDEDVAGFAVERLRLVDLDDGPVAHHGDALPERHRLCLIVRDVDRRDAEAGVQLRKRRAHADPELRVEVRQRFVHQERARLTRDRTTHRDTLALTTRQLRRLAVEQLFEPEQLRDLSEPLARLGLRRPADLEAVAEVLTHGHVWVQRVALEDHCDVAMSRREVGDVRFVDAKRPRRHILQTRHHPQERRLPAAGGPDEHDELPVRDREADVVHGPVPVAVDLRDVLETDRRHALAHLVPRRQMRTTCARQSEHWS